MFVSMHHTLCRGGGFGCDALWAKRPLDLAAVKISPDVTAGVV